MATTYYRPSSALLQGEAGLPDFDELHNLLPEYQYIFKDENKPRRPRTSEVQHDTSKPIDEETRTGMLHYQSEELRRYREATHKMGMDIIALNRQLAAVKGERDMLMKQKVTLDDVNKLAKDTADYEGMTVGEVLERYVSLRRHFNLQTNQLRNNKLRVQEVQNTLIKRNDQVAKLMEVSSAHEAQSIMVQDLQKKAAKLKKVEDVCRRQEKVIERFEQVKLSENKKDEKINKILADENLNLREDIRKLKEEIKNQDKVDSTEIREKFLLQEQIDTSTSRITVLEQQMMENARDWAREKSELKQKLYDIPDVPSEQFGASYSLLRRPEPLELSEPSRRFSKAPPQLTRSIERRAVKPLNRFSGNH